MTKSLLFLLVFTTILLLFFSCSSTQKIASLKPEPDNAVPLLYDNLPSFVSLPVTVKLKDVENQTNKLLTGLIYDDSNIEDDDLEIKIWKQAPITIQNNGSSTEKIETILPLKAEIKYRIGTNKLGLNLYTIKEFKLDGVITLLSDVNLTNWKLNTKTELKSFDWNESPTVDVFGKSVPITYLINPAVKLFQSKIEKSIDESIEKSMDFKPQVLDALEKICTPFLMNEEYNSWLRVTPEELYTTNSKVIKNAITFNMGLKCTMETLVGEKPKSNFNKNSIVLKPVAKMPSNITANIVAVSTYIEASRIMTKNFSGQEFGSGSKKVKVENVSIWHKEGKMIIALDVLGSVNGTIYLSGFPKYNEKSKEIYFDKLDYVLDTRSKLMRTANWLLQGYVLSKIQESCRYSIQSNLDDGKQSMMQYLQNYSPMDGVFVNGTIEDIDFKRIQLTNQAIIAFLTIKGDVTINVDGLN